MKCQKLVYLLDNTSNQLSKFRIKNWVEINSDGRVTCNTNSQIEFKTNMLNSSLCIHTLLIGEETHQAADRNDKKVIFGSYALFIDCMRKITITQEDNANNFDVLISKFNFIEYSNSYSKILRSLWPFFKDEADDNIRDPKLF